MQKDKKEKITHNLTIFKKKGLKFECILLKSFFYAYVYKF